MGIFYSANRDGLHIWRSFMPDGSPKRLASANEFLSEIAQSEFRSISYTSLNGKELKAWVMLPIGYQPDRRYPLLTFVYPGIVYGDSPPRQIGVGIDSSQAMNLQLACAHGYAVLLPSMPLHAEGLAEDPMLRAQEGVMPAVDKVIELGIADSRKLFLMGMSFGGFATYGLVTQTNRFRAAVSLYGYSDLISLYGVFDARERYTDHPQENMGVAGLLESAQFRMGGPPWKDLGRYLRNSPIFYVDRVETPIMIVQGDIDYIPIQQGEEFFSALYRQGKRAEFVRYWGEGHGLNSPANIRDMWTRIFAWLDQ